MLLSIRPGRDKVNRAPPHGKVEWTTRKGSEKAVLGYEEVVAEIEKAIAAAT